MWLIEDQIIFHRASLMVEDIEWSIDFDGTWAAIALSQQFARRDAAEAAVLQMYQRARLHPPNKIVWCGSPLALAVVRKRLFGQGEEGDFSITVPESVTQGIEAGVCDALPSMDSRKCEGLWKRMLEASPPTNDFIRSREDIRAEFVEIRHDLKMICYQGSLRYRVMRLLMPSLAETHRQRRSHCIKEAIASETGELRFSQITPWVFPHRDVCLVSENPIEILRNGKGRIHSLNGPAIRYPDGFGLYAINGMLVPEHVVMRPNQITTREIKWEFNQEVRRVLIERYGTAKYFLNSDAQSLCHDDVGILYHKKSDLDEEDIVMVRVLNATPEPDGPLSRDEAIVIFGEAAQAAINAPEDARFKEYMLRVPLTVRTAREAVAWTFGLQAEDYCPAIES